MDERSTLLIKNTKTIPQGKIIAQSRWWNRLNNNMPADMAAQRKFVVGVGLLLCVVLLWTFSSFITSDLLGGGYDKPFFITYLNTSAFVFYLIPAMIRYKRAEKKEAGDVESSNSEPLLNEHPILEESLPRRSNSLIRSLSPSPALNLNHPPYTSSVSSNHIPLPSIEESPISSGSSGSFQTVHIPRRSFDRGRRSDSVSKSMTGSSSGRRRDEVFREGVAVENVEKLSMRETARLAVEFCLVWFAANWSVNASLGFTSVGSSTVLAGMSGFFTLGLGRLFGVESFSRAKIAAVCASFIGLLLVTHSDSNLATSSTSPSSSLSSVNDSIITAASDSYNYTLSLNSTQIRALFSPDVMPHPPILSEPKNAIFGDMLALLSAVFYAAYVILLKKRIGNEERIDMQLFFGCVGLFNTIFLFPVLFLLHISSVEKLELPSQTGDLITVGINMLITLSSDYLYVLAMLRTSPLVVTVGLSLTIPFAMLGDFLRGSSATLTIQSLLGAVLVIAGFLLMGAEGWEEGMSTHTGEGEVIAAEFALGEEEELMGEGDGRNSDAGDREGKGKGKQRDNET